MQIFYFKNNFYRAKGGSDVVVPAVGVV